MALTFWAVPGHSSHGNDVDCDGESRCHKEATWLSNDLNSRVSWEVLVKSRTQYITDLQQSRLVHIIYPKITQDNAKIVS